MNVLFVLITAVLILTALAVVIVPLMRATPAPDAATDGTDDARMTILADSMRELDAELEAGTLARNEYDEARAELEQQALDTDAAGANRFASAGRAAWAPALAVGIALPLLTLALYLVEGQPGAILPATRTAGAVAQHANGESNARLATMIAKLKQRLQEDGGDPQDWMLLARSYSAEERPQDAIEAYQTAVDLAPENANLLIEYANVVAATHDHALGGKPQQLIDKALRLEPENMNALALAGAAALQQGANEDALRYWRHLKRLVPADSPDQARVDVLIARAEGKRPAVAVNAGISGTVTVSDTLADRITAGDTLFIFARAPDGPPMPLAVVRKSAPRFPAQFTLDDTRAMAPGLQLSQYANVDIVARVSRTGSATLRPGDLEGRIDSVALGSKDVRIVIDHRVGS